MYWFMEFGGDIIFVICLSQSNIYSKYLALVLANICYISLWLCLIWLCVTNTFDWLNISHILNWQASVFF